MYFEDARTELKREMVDDIKKEILAFLNTSGGTIYVGVNDDGTINGDFVKNLDKDAINNKLANWLEDSFYPSPSNLINYSFNDDNVLVINIKMGEKKPYFLRDKGPKPSGVYKRVGSTIRKVNEDEILLMIMNSNSYVYENGQSEEQELTFKALKNVFDEQGVVLNKRTFNSLGFYNKNSKYTNLAWLLSDQSNIKIKVAEFDENLNFKVKKEFVGSLIKCFFEVRDQVLRLNDTSAIINASTFMRIEQKSYPEIALREAIVNAFCHANYFIRSDISIYFYPDKVKISNPGGIFNATLEEILNGTQTYRNPKLVHVFDKLKIIENFGMGILRIQSAYANSSLKPKFESTDNHFYVYLPNLNYKDNQNKPNNDISFVDNSLNDDDLEILKIINVYPGIKVNDIYNILLDNNTKVTIDVIRNALKRKLEKYVIFKGSKKTGGYFIRQMTQ